MASENFYDFKDMSKTLTHFDLVVDKEKIRSPLHERGIFQATNQIILKIVFETGGVEKRINVPQRVRKASGNVDPDKLNVNQYADQGDLEIDREKYNDLMKMRDKGIIPKVHHAFFKTITWE